MPIRALSTVLTVVAILFCANCAQRQVDSQPQAVVPPPAAELPAKVESAEPPRDPIESAAEPTNEPATPIDDPPPQPVILRPFPHIEVHVDTGEVRFEGIACLDVGWLEQVVCAPQSREHESLIVSAARPSDLHAALLAAGFQPGAPGRWSYDNDVVSVSPPTGEAVKVEVIYENRAGQLVREPVGAWIRDHRGEHDFPDRPWVFGGSRMRKAPASMGGGEIYEADYSGSVIGLVTFGDEVLGWSEVMADQEAVHPPEWEVNSTHVPPPGTPVTVILTRAKAPPTGD